MTQAVVDVRVDTRSIRAMKELYAKRLAHVQLDQAVCTREFGILKGVLFAHRTRVVMRELKTEREVKLLSTVVGSNSADGQRLMHIRSAD